MSVPFSPAKCLRKLYSFVVFVVFLVFDFLDSVLCLVYKFLDKFIDGEVTPCYCERSGKQSNNVDDDDGGGFLSDTLYKRKNIFRELGFLKFPRNWEDCRKKSSDGKRAANRWSDCGCVSCLSWANDADPKLHFVVREPSIATDESCRENPDENVIFLHGFLGSSSFWTESVFPNFSDQVKQNHRLIAIDLLGFGMSPKPRDCQYTLKDHVEMIEKSVIQPFQLSNIHLVAHSMGCIIALALAAKYSKCVKSVTLVAPPYLSSKENDACLNALTKIAGKKLWPPLSFGFAFMSWYEHLGRSFCLVFCRNHRVWEKIIKFITGKRDIHFLAIDLTRHTHQSAWSSMHNVICGGAKFVDNYLEILNSAGVKINVVQGDKDKVVPRECSSIFKLKSPKAEIDIIKNAGHSSVVFGREKEFASDLQHIWACCN